MFKKIKIYLADQSQFATASSEELSRLGEGWVQKLHFPTNLKRSKIALQKLMKAHEN